MSLVWFDTPNSIAWSWRVWQWGWALRRQVQFRLLSLAVGSGQNCFGGILVDPASSHMLVSKIKPCMSKFTPLYGETANGSLNHT